MRVRSIVSVKSLNGAATCGREVSRRLAEVRRVADLRRARGIAVVHSHLTRANNFAVGLHLLHRFSGVVRAHANHFQLHN
jgi:hypothetical protein